VNSLTRLKPVTLVVFLLVTQCGHTQSMIDSVFNELEKVMAQRNIYDQEKEKHLLSLKSLLLENGKPIKKEETFQVNTKLIEEYWPYSFDTTLSYINRNLSIALDLNHEEWTNRSKLDLALLLASSGRYKEAQDILKTITSSRLTSDLKIKYFNCYRKIYSDLDYFAFESTIAEDYAAIYRVYTDSVLSLVKQDDDDYLYAQEWELLAQGRLEECLQVNSLRLSKANMATEKYSYITFQRSMAYSLKGDNNMEEKYLALSAISDIMASRKDNASLAKLAWKIYQAGDIKRAYKYIKYSFEDAIFYNSKLRFVEIANPFSIIMESHQIEKDKQNRALLIFTLLVSALSILLLLLLYFVYEQKKKLQKAKGELHLINEQYKKVNFSLQETMLALKTSYKDLAESNHIKELYIGSFMNIYSDFIDKLDKYRLTVNRMLRAKKYQQLFDMTSTMESIDEEFETFYATFDKTFLSLYPSFVKELNDLLVEDERIELKNGEILNPELRILAVIRLGIKDSARIAQLLRYSVNTIYNYRVKIKNKAKGNREEFENQIQQIGAHELIS
jgi:phosphopantetheine adenylyltransferase